MYRQCSCLYRYSAYIFNIGTNSDPYSSVCATLQICYTLYLSHYATLLLLFFASFFCSQTVTFQCILATDGTNSFVFFLYGDGEINSYSGYRAQVGLNAGNGVDFISVNGSLTNSIFNIDQDSNVGCPGVFVFKVNGGVQQPESGRNGKFYHITLMYMT